MLYVTSVTCNHSLSCDFVLPHLAIASYTPVYTQNVNRRIEIPCPSMKRQWVGSIFERLISKFKRDSAVQQYYLYRLGPLACIIPWSFTNHNAQFSKSYTSYVHKKLQIMAEEPKRKKICAILKYDRRIIKESIMHKGELFLIYLIGKRRVMLHQWVGVFLTV